MYGLFEEAGVRPDIVAVVAVFLGIAYDMRLSALSQSRTLEVAANLVEKGVVAEKLLLLFGTPMESSEKIARIKSTQRPQQRSIEEWPIACSSVGSISLNCTFLNCSRSTCGHSVWIATG